MRLNVNKIQFPYDKHHKVSSFIDKKNHQNTQNSVKYEVIWKCQIPYPTKYELLIKQYLRSILDISVRVGSKLGWPLNKMRCKHG